MEYVIMVYGVPSDTHTRAILTLILSEFIFLILLPYKLGFLALALKTTKISDSLMKFCTGKRPLVRPENMKGIGNP